MHKVTLTNLFLTILIAICSAASLTDEDIAKILDGTTGGDGMANLGEYETDLQLGNLRDKLRTLENLKTANTDLYPAQDPEILSDAVTGGDNLTPSQNGVYEVLAGSGKQGVPLVTVPSPDDGSLSSIALVNGVPVHVLDRRNFVSDLSKRGWREKTAFAFLARHRAHRRNSDLSDPLNWIEPNEINVKNAYWWLEPKEIDLKRPFRETSWWLEPNEISLRRPFQRALWLHPDEMSISRPYRLNSKPRDEEILLRRGLNDLDRAELSGVDADQSNEEKRNYFMKRKKRSASGGLTRSPVKRLVQRRWLNPIDVRPYRRSDFLKAAARDSSIRNALRSALLRNNICGMTNDCAWDY